MTKFGFTNLKLYRLCNNISPGKVIIGHGSELCSRYMIGTIILYRFTYIIKMFKFV